MFRLVFEFRNLSVVSLLIACLKNDEKVVETVAYFFTLIIQGNFCEDRRFFRIYTNFQQLAAGVNIFVFSPVVKEKVNLHFLVTPSMRTRVNFSYFFLPPF